MGSRPVYWLVLELALGGGGGGGERGTGTEVVPGVPAAVGTDTVGGGVAPR